MGSGIVEYPTGIDFNITVVLTSFFIAGGLFRAIGVEMLQFPRWGWSVFGGIVSRHVRPSDRSCVHFDSLAPRAAMNRSLHPHLHFCRRLQILFRGAFLLRRRGLCPGDHLRDVV